MSLSSRIQYNHIQDQKTRIVTKVEKLEPLSLRKEWIHDLAHAVTFLESLNLAHGNLRPETILLNQNRLKLSDFDCTAEIGANFKACMAPYGRILNSNETDQRRPGTSGFLDSRTEQFALSSLYYLINYSFKVYRDRCLTEDPTEHGPKVVDLLQHMEFPKLDSDPQIDDIIEKCWHNKYTTVAELAAHTQAFTERSNEEGTNEGTNAKSISITRWCRTIDRVIRGLWCYLAGWRTLMPQSADDEAINTELCNGKEPDGQICDNMDQDHPEKFITEKVFCQDLEKRGLLHLLSSDEPEQLGSLSSIIGTVPEVG